MNLIQERTKTTGLSKKMDVKAAEFPPGCP